MSLKTTAADFQTGLVFGFDVGSGSIGYAVRKGSNFKDVGVLICPEDTNDLSGRRGLRRQRRTLRSRKARRAWFANELVKIGITRPQQPPHDPITLRVRALNGDKLKPEELHAALTHLFKRRGYSKVPWANLEKAAKETAKPKSDDDEGEIMKAAIGIKAEMEKRGCQHPCQYLARRRKEVGQSPTEKWGRKIYWLRDLLEGEFRAIAKAQKDNYPELLKNADRLLFGETRAIKRQVDGTEKEFHVFFNATGSRNPGVLGMRWPRFDNRGPGLDALEPYRKDEKSGAWIPQHTMRRDNRLFKEWQLDVKLNAFVVIRRLPPAGKRQKEKIEKFPPPPPALNALRKMWNERGHLWAEDLQEWAKNYTGQFELRDPDENLTPKNDFTGRARFSKPGMAAIRKAISEAREKHDVAYEAWEKKFREKNQKANEEDIANGYARFLTLQAAAAADGDPSNSYARTIAPPPVLMLPDESQSEALRRYINAIRDPRVRHRVELFTREFKRLINMHCNGSAPDFVVIEMARDLMMNDEQKKLKEEKDKERKAERDKAAQILRDMGFRPDDESIKKFMLAQEVGWRCPFTLQPFCQSDFSNLTITQLVQAENKPRFVREAKSVFERLEVEHLVPRTPIVCNEWFNLTVTLNVTNAQKRKRTPFQWLSADKDGLPQDLTWERVCKEAALRFGEGSLKYQIFTSADAARLIEENAKRSIQQTAYITRCLREACLILFGKSWLDWTDGVGRDPRLLKNNRASTSFLTTNGVITSRLRNGWNLNEVLHPRATRTEWDELSDEERKMRKLERALKNRQDHRHHAIDAMVISCTLPWLAYKSRVANNSTDDGWCEVNPETGEITKIWNPVFNDYGFGIKKAAEAKAALLVRHSSERKNDLLRHHKPAMRNAQAFDTTPYGRREKFGGDEIGQTLFVARKRLLDLKTSHLNPLSTGGFIFSPLLREQIAKGWAAFSSDSKNWIRVQTDWIARFETELIKLRASGRDDQKTRAGIRARELRIQRLKQMESAKNWDELLKFIDKELGAQQPQPRFPAQFVATLRHPIYNTPITSVKVTAQSKDDDSFLLVRELTPPKARSGTYVMRKQEDKYREMRVYRLAKPGRAGAYACWLVLPWYENMDSRGKRFKKVADKFMPAVCKSAMFVKSFRKEEVVCFMNNQLADKNIKQGESWRIVGTEAKGEYLVSISLLPAHLVKETVHPITGEKVRIDPVLAARRA
jgi:CRISPR-associated endonuclease Csn1